MTLEKLQQITLASQGLLQTSPFGKGKKAVLHAIENLGYLQIDTISIIERAHHHTLWTRIPDYKTTYLEELVKERKVFEYWFHAASYLPMKDFRFVLPKMSDVKQNKAHYYKAEPKVMRYVRDTIRGEGPKMARDFESETKNAGNWWNWKPTKMALERLFLQGELMIVERNGMQKTYDITERVLPDNIDLTMPDPIEYAAYLVRTYLQAYGFTTLKQITHLKTDVGLRKNVNEVLQFMLSQKSLEKIDIDGLPTIYIQNDLTTQKLKKAEAKIRFLSPFDNFIIHRERIKQLFNFDYRIECYTPKEKRQYGYFCLPILFGNTFIGRADCKAHRKEKEFEVILLHIENPNIDIELWLHSFTETIKQFATFNGCQSIKISQVSPSKFTKTLKKSIPKHD